MLCHGLAWVNLERLRPDVSGGLCSRVLYILDVWECVELRYCLLLVPRHLPRMSCPSDLSLDRRGHIGALIASVVDNVLHDGPVPYRLLLVHLAIFDHAPGLS